MVGTDIFFEANATGILSDCHTLVVILLSHCNRPLSDSGNTLPHIFDTPTVGLVRWPVLGGTGFVTVVDRSTIGASFLGVGRVTGIA
jgi:hypothetical protein